MADQLPGRVFPSHHSSEWRQNDERAAERVESEYNQILLTGNGRSKIRSKIKLDPPLRSFLFQGSDMRRGFLRGVQAVGGVQEIIVLPQFLPRDRSRAEEIWADRLEQSVRIQRD